MATVAEATDGTSESSGERRALTPQGKPNLRPWAKGVSGNPGGRSPGLARRIKEATNEGQDLVDFLLSVVTNPREKTGDQIAAARELLDRGWGRPEQSLELKSAEQPTLGARIALMSPQEKANLRKAAVLEIERQTQAAATPEDLDALQAALDERRKQLKAEGAEVEPLALPAPTSE